MKTIVNLGKIKCLTTHRGAKTLTITTPDGRTKAFYMPLSPKFDSGASETDNRLGIPLDKLSCDSKYYKNEWVTFTIYRDYLYLAVARNGKPCPVYIRKKYKNLLIEIEKFISCGETSNVQRWIDATEKKFPPEEKDLLEDKAKAKAKAENEAFNIKMAEEERIKGLAMERRKEEYYEIEKLKSEKNVEIDAVSFEDKRISKQKKELQAKSEEIRQKYHKRISELHELKRRQNCLIKDEMKKEYDEIEKLKSEKNVEIDAVYFEDKRISKQKKELQAKSEEIRQKYHKRISERHELKCRQNCIIKDEIWKIRKEDMAMLERLQQVKQ